MRETERSESSGTVGSRLTALVKVDAFHKHWWSGAPYRRIELRFTVHLYRFSGGTVLLELLLPVDALDNFSNEAGDWNPAYDCVVDGVDYFAWTENFGSFPIRARTSQPISATLAANFKPYVNPLPLLWHVCIGEDAAPVWNTQHIDLKTYTPSI